MFGILEILMGALFALMVPLMIFGTFASAHLNKDAASSINAGTIVPGLLFYCLLAVWFIWMGIGSIQARRWARALLLVSSWLWLVSGIMGLVLVSALLPAMYDQMGKSGKMPQEMIALVKYMTIGFMVIFYVVIPAALVLFYGSKHTKATCEQRDPRVGWTDACPLPVLALSLVSGSWALCMPLVGFYGWAVPFFGSVLCGIAGAGCVMVLALLSAYVAWGTYRLKIGAWWCAVGLLTIWGVSIGITFSKVGLMEYYKKMNLPAQQLEMMKQLAMQQTPWMILFCEIGVVAALAYLIYTRRFFQGHRQ